MGKSRGGLSTKYTLPSMRWATRPVCRPRRGRFPNAHRQALTEGLKADFVLADKGYAPDTFVDTIKNNHAVPVIPPKSNRKIARDYDKTLY